MGEGEGVQREGRRKANSWSAQGLPSTSAAATTVAAVNEASSFNTTPRQTDRQRLRKSAGKGEGLAQLL